MMIRSQDPQAVVDGGRELQGKAKTLDSLIGSQVAAVHDLEQHWKGEAANAARGHAYRNIQRQHRLHEIVDALATAMLSGGQALVTLRQVLLNWVSTLSQIFNIADDGVVTPRPPMTGAGWANTAATFTACTQSMIKAFLTQDEQLAKSLEAIARGDVPDNDPRRAPGFGPGIDPDGFNNSQFEFQQTMAGSGDPLTGEGGVGVPNTDLSIMGMTPDGRLFTIQGDTGTGMNPDTNGGPGPRPDEGGHNSIIYWKMDETGKWVQDEVVKDPFPPQSDPDGREDISTIPTSTFNTADGTMYASVMNVHHWNGPPGQRPPGESGWATRSSELWKSIDNGKTWEKTNVTWPNDSSYSNPFQVQSFAPADDGYVYAYGTQDGRTNDGLHVARVPEQYVTDSSKYEYWNGKEFSAGQDPNSSPPVIKTPPGVSGIGEPSVHFYENKVLVTFNDENGGVFTSSSTTGTTGWSVPTEVIRQPGTYGAFQSPFSGGDSIDATLSLWNPYGTSLYQIENEDTKNLGAY
ncbi:DUF4185 domain-containing protein [[Mycobacterium] fortunisiensis]|nr:DUF4185 domain-containing protein [[Mycobacterium] fortunisiensis]